LNRSRHTRANPDERPPHWLTDRDAEIIKTVNDCRALLHKQLERLFFSSASSAYGRLQKLFQHEYLERRFINTVTRAPAAAQMLYTLGQRGAAVLGAYYGYGKEQCNFPTEQFLTWKVLDHHLAVCDFRVDLTKAAQEEPFELVEWVDEYAFRSKPDMVWIEGKGDKQSKKPVLPDGYFILSTPKGNARCFVEMDLGTEGLYQFRSQIAIYQEYMHSGKYQERFGSKSLRVLVVTTSPKRLESLKKAITDEGGGQRYLVTTKAQISSETVITRAIWHREGSEQPVSLIG
jgi:hypothetical protein